MAQAATKGRFKGNFKKRGPLVGIIFAIFGVAALMGGTQFFQPFSLVAQLQETFNSMHVSANSRSTRFLRWQLDSGRVKDPVKGQNSIFGARFKISDKQAEELKKQGIEYDKDAGVLRYTTASGEAKEVGAADFKKVYDTDAEFFHKYNAGSMTWRGQFANWFGGNTTKWFKNNGLTRNMFHNFKKKAAEARAKGKSSMEALREVLRQRTDKAISDGGVRIRLAEENTEEDEDGNPRGTGTYSDTGNSDSGSSTLRRDDFNSIEKTRQKLTDVANRYSGSDRGGIFTTAVNVSCMGANIIGGINAMVAALEALQIINLATSFMETVNKTQAGYGDEAPINEFANALNDKQARNYTTLTESVSGGEGIDGLDEIEVVENGAHLEGTAMQAAAVAALYSGGRVNPEDPSVQSFNINTSMKRIMNGMGVSMDSFRACTLARTAANLVDLGIDLAGSAAYSACAAGIAGAVATVGVGTPVAVAACVPAIGKTLLEIGKGILKGAKRGIMIHAIVSLLTPVVTDIMTRDLISNLGGQDLGNAITFGANMYQSGVHKYNGGSLATIPQYEQFAVTQAQVVAEDAREERESLSPFDITSKNTFMGTILTQMMSFNTASSLMSTITTGGSVMTSSLVGLVEPAAMAYDIADYLPDSIEEYGEYCPYLASIGAIGDSGCNYYSITDLTPGDAGTIDVDPMEIIAILGAGGNFESEQTGEGNVVIKGGSDLAKYIVFCANRESPFGVADQNIANEVSNFGQVNTGNGAFDAAVNGAIGMIPFVGEVIDLVDNEQARRNMGYISGESCVAGNNLATDGELFAESPAWDMAKYYQRFIEDQSLAESMGLISESAVSVFMNEYYAVHPLDDSYEGMLARRSGLSKETMVDLMDIMAYYEYLDNYDASERYAFGSMEVEDNEVVFEHENVLASGTVPVEDIVYADVRNRSFAV